MRHPPAGIRLLGGAILATVITSPVAAQLPNPSAVAAGMGDNYTALARGFSAVAWNPAGLAQAENPRFSGSIFALRGVAGLNPVGLGDLADFEGRVLPEEVRRRWLDRIVSSGGQRGSAGAELTYVAAQAGRFGVQVTSTGHLTSSMSPGAAELLLFGNARRSGELTDLDLHGSSLDLTVVSSAAVSYAVPLIREEGRSLSLGGTIKYIVGHVLVTAADAGSGVTADPLEIRLDFPVVQIDTLGGRANGRDRGMGFGLDLGIAWREGPIRAGLVARNLFNTFAWNEDRLSYRPGAAVLSDDTRTTDMGARPFTAAPEPVRERVRDLRYPPVLAIGVGYQVRSDLLLSADLRGRLGSAQRSEPASHLGLGAEYRLSSRSRLRAGTALVSGGFLLSAGSGLELGRVHFDGAIGRRWTDLGGASIAMLAFSLESGGGTGKPISR